MSRRKKDTQADCPNYEETPSFESTEEGFDYPPSAAAFNYADRIIKIIPELKDHKDDLAALIDSHILEAQLKYAERQDTQWKLKIENAKIIRERNKKANKLINQLSEILPGPWIQDMRNEIGKADVDNKDKKPTRNVAPIIAKSLKDFWLHALGHEKFFYGDQKYPPEQKKDDATNFIKTFREIVYQGHEDLLTDEAFFKIRDMRKNRPRKRRGNGGQGTK